MGLYLRPAGRPPDLVDPEVLRIDLWIRAAEDPYPDRLGLVAWLARAVPGPGVPLAATTIDGVARGASPFKAAGGARTSSPEGFIPRSGI